MLLIIWKYIDEPQIYIESVKDHSEYEDFLQWLAHLEVTGHKNQVVKLLKCKPNELHKDSNDLKLMMVRNIEAW